MLAGTEWAPRFATGEVERPRPALRRFRDYVVKSLVAGLLVVVPGYLAILLLIKLSTPLRGMVEPIAGLLPEWLPAERLLSCLGVLLVVLLIGVAVQTPWGKAARHYCEKTVLGRLPGYSLMRGLIDQMAGEGHDRLWEPALIEIEDALQPGFIIEAMEDGRFTVFVPSVPTPFAGAIYIITPERVHALDVPLTQAIKTVLRWGAGSKDLVAAMKTPAR